MINEPFPSNENLIVAKNINDKESSKLDIKVASRKEKEIEKEKGLVRSIDEDLERDTHLMLANTNLI